MCIRDSSYRVRIEPSRSSGPNTLVDQLRTSIDPDHEPWATLAQVIQKEVGVRGRQLADRLQADASTLNQLNRETDTPPEPTVPPT